ncbi:putative microtubule-associated protein futsch-like [Scophthalmus maximus]|uniref:Putative microtubule-associated protein futsch-like n=1 Tax=Scophthalmus maximus TaxID=52904 RepID=A0A2U9BQF8_SCOMX|nr:putative microtubule-associated protein futsch-like [Scophthalmus maximus]
MKPDGVTMETPEPTEAAAIAEPSLSQDNATEQTSSQPEETANDAAPAAAPKASGKPVAVDPKVKPKAVTSKTQPKPKSAGVSGSNSRPGAASHRTQTSSIYCPKTQHFDYSKSCCCCFKNKACDSSLNGSTRIHHIQAHHSYNQALHHCND